MAMVWSSTFHLLDFRSHKSQTSQSSHNQIVLVEFDPYKNLEWDPPMEHVGINIAKAVDAIVVSKDLYCSCGRGCGHVTFSEL